MLRAFSSGYMPSTEQTIVNIRTLLASDVLNPSTPELSDSGRLLVKYTKQLLTDFIELLRHKNDADQIQDFIWFLSKARVSIDAEDLARTASTERAKADASAALESLKTVGSLLLTNSDFRLFLGDLNVVGRQVFADTAFAFSDVAKDAGKQLEPPPEDTKTIKNPGSEPGPPPDTDDIRKEATEVSKVVVNGLSKTGGEAVHSLKENVSGDQKETLLFRLKQAVVKLRKRNDYSDSVSTIGLLLKRYAKVYSRAVDNSIDTVQADVHANDELDLAVKNFWALITSFGDRKAWDDLETKFKAAMRHADSDPEFEKLMNDIGNSVEKLLTDPDFFESANDKIEQLRQKFQGVGGDSTLRDDVVALFEQMQTTFHSLLNDEDVSKLISTSIRIVNIISPVHTVTNGELINDCLHVFIPQFIQAIQYVPIPRVEVSTPEIDLLLESLIVEPGRTVNHSSFLPYKLKVETYNDLEIRKAKFRTVSQVTSLVTIKVDGLSMRADEIGFWMRAHKGLLRLADEGIASFQLDERGIDIHIDVEVGKERLESILTLRDVRVKIHKLSYNLRKSKFAVLAWVLKPLLRPVIRKVMEKQIATAIADGLHAANRELVFARERLRATRISDPQDLRTFVKAVLARLTPAEDPDLYATVGVDAPRKGIFAGVYAPGSVVKLWHEEAERAGEVVDDYAVGGWRNEVFDVHTQMMGQ
ncbi:MAG: hypothetical protein M1832_003751 [Thelocarpon impressellum]|nr:MAG: hypothetical protein M1832_003751 [Thelocarpon impressellum]